MSDWKNRLKSESQHGVTAAPEALADVIIDKGSRKVLDKFGVNERTLEADQAQADPEYAANKVIKEAVHTLQNDEVAKTGHTEAGGVAAAAQAVQAKKDEGHPGEAEYDTAGIVKQRIAQLQEIARRGGNFTGPNPAGTIKTP
eukprot:jgi/Botrbrau1/6145/Bobra.331_2s0036.1